MDGDLAYEGAYENAYRAFEDSRPDLILRASSRLTGEGTCVSCKAEGVALFRTADSVDPDTCTTCRGPVR